LSCIFACSLHELFSRRPTSLGKAIADGILKRSISSCTSADPFADHLAHGFGVVEQRLLGQVADFDPRLGPRLAFDFLIESGHDLSSVDLAGSVRPSTPIFRAPEKKLNVMSRRMTRLGGTNLATRFMV